MSTCTDNFEIIYAAHTAACTFLLDREGICRRIVVTKGTSKRRDAALAAQRCVGAQYVASLDQSVTGMLTEMPRAGGAMLFARVDERGRVSLVRTGVVTRFESNRKDEDPFSSADKAPSMSVQTSAPEIPPSAPAPRRSRPVTAPDIPRAAQEVPSDVYSEPEGDRTQPIQASDVRSLLRNRAAASSAEIDDQSALDETAEYHSEGSSSKSTGSGSGARRLLPPTTLRQLPAAMPRAPDDESPYTRGAVPAPRRSEPQYVGRSPTRVAPPLPVIRRRSGDR